jgi:predicted SnoaL-like aldol condensation-catalyzing enzyme
MGSIDPKQIALQFNECINTQNICGISDLMTEDHRFIDRAGMMVSGKESMTNAWIRFFELFPEYQNTFERVETHNNFVILYGHATWKKGDDPDHAIWTATIENDLVAEWRI